jgi:hypothetical protein
MGYPHKIGCSDKMLGWFAIGTYSADGAALPTNGVAVLTAADDRDFTLAAPTPGSMLHIIAETVAADKAAVVTLPEGVTFDGTNNTATFGTSGDSIALCFRSATRWQILDNNGVALSAV